MLSGESTPLLKESVQLRDGTDILDINGADRNSVLFSGTKALQVSRGSPEAKDITSKCLTCVGFVWRRLTLSDFASAPDEGCLALVLRTGFGTTQGQLVRTMIFSTERVSANNLESFIFIGFLLIFAIAASAYVWIEGAWKP
jgi:cation-transporting ATPase 13A1